jgi:hypothetical protein
MGSQIGSKETLLCNILVLSREQLSEEFDWAIAYAIILGAGLLGSKITDSPTMEIFNVDLT